jgi:hypothetical protein
MRCSDTVIVGTYVMAVAENSVTVTGELKAYEDKKTDSGTLLLRYFCPVCGW